MDDSPCLSTIFKPPLWKQRRQFILDTLKQHKIQKVIDYGCGEGSILSYLIPTSVTDDINFTHLIGLDIDKELLMEETISHCEPWQTDYQQLRETPLIIDIYHGSVDQKDKRIKDSQCEALICTEVIEHVYPITLKRMIPVCFQYYQPSLLIFTTPNAEYNHFFTQLNYGTEYASFRHDDHKFEWTRLEFESWCNEIGNQYDYNVEFHGIGLINGRENEIQHGHCTQACIFTKKIKNKDTHQDNTEKNPIIIKEEEEENQPYHHTLLKHIEFPYYQQNLLLDDDEILHQIESHLSDLCQDKTLYYQFEQRQHQQQNKDISSFSSPSLSLSSLSSSSIYHDQSQEGIGEEQKENPRSMSLLIDQQFNNMIHHIHASGEWYYNQQDHHLLNSLNDAKENEEEKKEENEHWTLVPIHLPIETIWSLLPIRQLCITKLRLFEILNLKKNDYQVMGSDLVVHKSFKFVN
ncbi:unnamed protein product [Cunninghamella blakesleeana]